MIISSSNSNSQSQFIPDDLFTEIVALMPIVTTDLVLINEDKEQILLFKRTNKPAQDIYFTPGGRLWKNEEFLQGIKRQGQRELGLSLDESRLSWGGVINEMWADSEFADHSYNAISIFWGYLISETELQSLALDEQHCDYQWFDFNDDRLHPYICYRLKTLNYMA